MGTEEPVSCILRQRRRTLHAFTAPKSLTIGEAASKHLLGTIDAQNATEWFLNLELQMIKILAPGGYRLYSRKKNVRTGRRHNLGIFSTRAGAEKHEWEVQYFKRRSQAVPGRKMQDA